MLVHGAPEDDGRPRTWLETVGYPLLFLLLFTVTFLLFLRYVPPEKKRKFTLPSSKDRQQIIPKQAKAPMQQQNQEQDDEGDTSNQEL